MELSPPPGWPMPWPTPPPWTRRRVAPGVPAPFRALVQPAFARHSPPGPAEPQFPQMADHRKTGAGWHRGRASPGHSAPHRAGAAIWSIQLLVRDRQIAAWFGPSIHAPAVAAPHGRGRGRQIGHCDRASRLRTSRRAREPAFRASAVENGLRRVRRQVRIAGLAQGHRIDQAKATADQLGERLPGTVIGIPAKQFDILNHGASHNSCRWTPQSHTDPPNPTSVTRRLLQPRLGANGTNGSVFFR